MLAKVHEQPVRFGEMQPIAGGSPEEIAGMHPVPRAEVGFVVGERLRRRNRVTLWQTSQMGGGQDDRDRTRDLPRYGERLREMSPRLRDTP